MSTSKNQCDGCCQGNIPDKGGFHRNTKGAAYMLCESSKYSLDVNKQEVTKNMKYPTEHYFIAICRCSDNIDNELAGYYARDYLKNKDHHIYINSLLLDIVNKYCKIDICKVVNQLSPDTNYNYAYRDSVRNLAVDLIRNAENIRFNLTSDYLLEVYNNFKGDSISPEELETIEVGGEKYVRVKEVAEWVGKQRNNVACTGLEMANAIMYNTGHGSDYFNV